MTRPPLARQKILQAAREIVESRGAGHLTFEELASVSGVTRGGITYHFPTKEALLKGLIEADIADWESKVDALEAECVCPRTAEVLGQIRCNLAPPEEGHSRFVTGLMSAAMVDPSLLDPIRNYQKRKFANRVWDDAEIMRYILLLAAEGMFWQHFFDMSPLPPEVRQRVAARIEALAQQSDPSTPPPQD